MARNRLTDSIDDRIFYTVNTILLLFVFAATIYPIIFIASASFSSPEAVTTGRVTLWPVEASLKGYFAVFRNRSILTGYYNSLIYTVVGTGINVCMTILAAFPLSRKELVGFRTINFLFVFTLWFSGGLIPNYLLVKQLGMINRRWALWLPGAIGVWNVMITRTFFQHSVPDEMYESAVMDGCGYTRYLWSIVLRLSGAVIAVITLFYAVGHWNSYFNALIFIQSSRLNPLQIVLRNILIQNEVSSDMLGGVDFQRIAELEGLR